MRGPSDDEQRQGAKVVPTEFVNVLVVVCPRFISLVRSVLKHRGFQRRGRRLPPARVYSMSKVFEFDEAPILQYLGLEKDYTPSPKADPIAFLQRHLTQLPPHLLVHCSLVTTPKQRTVIPTVRNRRLKWSRENPPELSLSNAQNNWPGLWEGRLRPGVEEAKEERKWAETEFLQGTTKQIGKLGNLLSIYEEERENERVRALRRYQEADEFVPEEDEDTDEEEEEDDDSEKGPPTTPEPESDSDRQRDFERRVQERFIYGLLEVCMPPIHSRAGLIALVRESIMIKWTGTNLSTTMMTAKQRNAGLTRTTRIKYTL